jgi:hypothetical protein
MAIYGLQDNGVPLAETQRDITPMQRFVYTLAKDHHTEDVDVDEPNGMNRAHSATSGF